MMFFIRGIDVMKKIFSLLIAIVIMLSVFCGCYKDSNGNGQTSFDKTDNSNTQLEITEDVNVIKDFSEGLAWITYGEPSNWGCINKNGEVLFSFSEDIYTNPENYYNGYSYIKSENGTKLNVIDKTGAICSSYDVRTEVREGYSTTITNHDEHVVAYGCGYTVVLTHKADFDSAYYLYTIYDANGNVMDTYKTNNDETIHVRHCGEGIFYFDDDYEKKSVFFDEVYYKRHYYFAELKKWVVTEYSEIDDVTFYNNYALLQLDYSDEEYRCEFIFMDLEGNIKKVKVSEEYGWNFQVNSIYDDICLFIDEDDALSTYDFASDTFRTLANEDYISKVDWERSDEIICNDNAIIVPLIGEDKQNYVAVFDKEWNIILEPFKATEFSFINDERFIIDSELIYDTKGNLICDVTSSNLGSVRAYFDGVTVANDSEYDNPYGSYLYKDTYFEFLDTDGKLLFKSITVSSEN